MTAPRFAQRDRVRVTSGPNAGRFAMVASSRIADSRAVDPGMPIYRLIADPPGPGIIFATEAELKPTRMMPEEVADLPDPPTLDDLLKRVRAERQRQDELHPRDDWPMLSTITDHRLLSEMLEQRQRGNDWNQRQGAENWQDLLQEELLEAACEDTPEGQIRELVELAALALRAAEAIGRRV